MRKIIILTGILFFLFSYQLAGQTWSPIKRMTYSSGFSDQPSIAIDSGNGIHVVWTDNTPGNFEIFYKRSTNGGTNWSGIKRFTWTAGNSWKPCVATHSGNGIHVMWSDLTTGKSEIYYKRSSDGGGTWSGRKRLTWSPGNSGYPSIAINSGGEIHLLYTYSIEPIRSELYYKKSTDGGTTWTEQERLTWMFPSTHNPSVVIDTSNIIHVVWVEGEVYGTNVFYKRSTDGGGTWSKLKQLSWDTLFFSGSPSIATDSGTGVYVVWNKQTKQGPEIFFKHSTDSGATWSTLKQLTWFPTAVDAPSIAIDSGNGINIAFWALSPVKADIYYKRSTNSGVSWSIPTRLTWNERNSKSPSITAYGNDLHLVWYDDTLGNYEIFYKNRK